MVSRLERPRAAVYDRVLYATFETPCFGNFFFSYAPSGDAIASRRGQPCVKRMVVVSFEEHDLHMLAASWPAGFAVLRVGGCHIRSGWEWSRCLGAEPEGHLDAAARCRRCVTARAIRVVFDAADRSRSRAMSVVEGSEEVERTPRRTPTLCLMSTVVLGDAQHPGKLPERRVLLDLSIGACSAMHPHMLQ